MKTFISITSAVLISFQLTAQNKEASNLGKITFYSDPAQTKVVTEFLSDKPGFDTLYAVVELTGETGNAQYSGPMVYLKSDSDLSPEILTGVGNAAECMKGNMKVNALKMLAGVSKKPFKDCYESRKSVIARVAYADMRGALDGHLDKTGRYTIPVIAQAAASEAITIAKGEITVVFAEPTPEKLKEIAANFKANPPVSSDAAKVKAVKEKMFNEHKAKDIYYMTIYDKKSMNNGADIEYTARVVYFDGSKHREITSWVKASNSTAEIYSFTPQTSQIVPAGLKPLISNLK